MEENSITTLGIKIDKKEKAKFERILDELGLTVSGAIIMYVKTVIREQRIPFELNINPRIDPCRVFANVPPLRPEETGEYYSRANEARRDAEFRKSFREDEPADGDLG